MTVTAAVTFDRSPAVSLTLLIMMQTNNDSHTDGKECHVKTVNDQQVL